MRKTDLSYLILFAALTAIPATGFGQQSDAGKIIAVERAALDRWGKGDPQGYLDTYSDDITYFDPMQDKRLNGMGAMKALLDPLKGKIKVAKYDMIEPKVQQSGDMAVLSYNLLSYAQTPDGKPITVRWNSTAVYRRIQGNWRMVHNHWSLTKPDLKHPIPE